MEEQNQDPQEPAETPQEDAAQAAPAQPPEEDLRKKCDEYLEGWKRAMADYANLKKESERAQGELAKYASAHVIASLLPVLDSLKKAEAAKPTHFSDAAQYAKWADGISHVKTQFESVFKSAGVTVIDEAGVPFDPNKHEAMMMEKADKDHAAGVVKKVLEPGYKLHDRVIVPAKVVVAE